MKLKKDLHRRATGRFFTPALIGKKLAEFIVDRFAPTKGQNITVCEPFIGDGRLVVWLLEALEKKLEKPVPRIEVVGWDINDCCLEYAREQIAFAASHLGLDVSLSIMQADAFKVGLEYLGQFDICLTNPPWENLKPDRRELSEVDEQTAANFVSDLREQDKFLTANYVNSRPKKKFSGWGTNLSRCGTELAAMLTQVPGICGVVIPAQLLGDQVSAELRRWLFESHEVFQINFFEAEARLFESVDQACVTMVFSPGKVTTDAPGISLCDKHHLWKEFHLSNSSWAVIRMKGYVIPVQFGLQIVEMLAHLKHWKVLGELEGPHSHCLWTGRELDETGLLSKLDKEGTLEFLKGRMVKRYGFAEPPALLDEAKITVPVSANFSRVVWRDVARPNQKRRMHATIIPPGIVTGNSLHVAYFRNDDCNRLKALLAIINSYVFESQIRASIVTGHISLGAVRLAKLPNLEDENLVISLASLVDRALTGDEDAARALEVLVAKAYGLSQADFSSLLECFPKVTELERAMLLNRSEWRIHQVVPKLPCVNYIPNHVAPKLSALDLQIVQSIPPGGNWKNVPVQVPSRRLQTIRESFAAGKGSRSTYYGRLRHDKPAYTINTYFPRPGNGCHIHYDSRQQRTLSPREAARLQSFPDNFEFRGTKSSICKQIGNAVPPLMGYFIAKSLGEPGIFADLFCGAGGLGLGFTWAGWTPVIANDIDKGFLETYRHNIHEQVIVGDIRQEDVLNSLVEQCNAARRTSSKPFIVLGGPPCQGFSTAGKPRTMEDDRNWLFLQYKKFIKCTLPDAFVFENVSGLLSMENGRVFSMIRNELAETVAAVQPWTLQAEEYGVPQRRTRVILIGSNSETPIEPPPRITHMLPEENLFESLAAAVTVQDALGDLPPLSHGEDGSTYSYQHEPATSYQKFMRGHLRAHEFVQSMLLHHGFGDHPKSSSRAVL